MITTDCGCGTKCSIEAVDDARGIICPGCGFQFRAPKAKPKTNTITMPLWAWYATIACSVTQAAMYAVLWLRS